MQHGSQATNEHILYAVAVEAGEDRFRLECRHTLLVADEGARRPDGQVEAEEQGIGFEPLLWGPGETLHNQAPVVRVVVALPREHIAQNRSVWRGVVHGYPVSTRSIPASRDG